MTTFGPITQKGDQPSLFAEDSPVRTLASQGSAPAALRAPDRAYGKSTPVLLANYNPASSSWRTSQLSLEGGLAEFSETWPRSGLMRNGIAYQLPPLVPLTSETASGLLPTPQAIDWKGTCAKLSHKRWTTYHLKHWLHGTALAVHTATGKSSYPDPVFVEWLMRLPIGHLDLEPAVMRSSRKSSKSSVERS